MHLAPKVHLWGHHQRDPGGHWLKIHAQGSRMVPHWCHLVPKVIQNGARWSQMGRVGCQIAPKCLQNQSKTVPKHGQHILSGGPSSKIYTLGIPPLPLGYLLDLQNLTWGRPGASLGWPWDALGHLWGGLGRPCQTRYQKRAKKRSQNLIFAITVFNFWGGDRFAKRSVQQARVGPGGGRGEPP